MDSQRPGRRRGVGDGGRTLADAGPQGADDRRGGRGDARGGDRAPSVAPAGGALSERPVPDQASAAGFARIDGAAGLANKERATFTDAVT